MGIIVFAVLAVMEIVLAAKTCRNGGDRKVWKHDRLMIRAMQAAVIVIAMIVPAGQKWRWAPVLGWIVLLLIIAALSKLSGRKKENAGEGKPKKAAGTVTACILCILMTGVSLAPAFMFTGYNGLPVTGGYEVKEASAILIDETRNDPFEQDGSKREVPVHFYYPSTEGKQFPLVVFSHGAFGYYQSNTSTYMELASNGYVVAALDHPHHAFFTKDTDGKTVIVDMEFMNTAISITNGTMDISAEEEYKIYKDWMDLRTGDMNLAVDEIKRVSEGGSLNSSWFLSGSNEETILSIVNMTDTDKIGLMGHSMGGATSVALGRERDDIDAVIDMDGTMLAEYTGVADGKLAVNEDPYEVPVLEFTNWESYNELAEQMEKYRAEGGRYPNDELMRHAANGFTATVRDTKHMDYTDLPLLSPVLGKMLGSGERDKAEAMKIVNSLVLQFYDCYLKGEGGFAVENIY